MNRSELVQAAAVETAASREAVLEHRRQRVIKLLRETSEAVDSLWQASVSQSQDDLSVELGEASHAIHRALVALSRD